MVGERQRLGGGGRGRWAWLLEAALRAAQLLDVHGVDGVVAARLLVLRVVHELLQLLRLGRLVVRVVLDVAVVLRALKVLPKASQRVRPSASFSDKPTPRGRQTSAKRHRQRLPRFTGFLRGFQDDGGQVHPGAQSDREEMFTSNKSKTKAKENKKKTR